MIHIRIYYFKYIDMIIKIHFISPRNQIIITTFYQVTAFMYIITNIIIKVNRLVFCKVCTL
jgi:hypothetical protein